MSIPLLWRPIVAVWPTSARLAFGLRANELADQGHIFPEDEHIAFDELRPRVEAGEFPADESGAEPASEAPQPQPAGKRWRRKPAGGEPLFEETSP